MILTIVENFRDADGNFDDNWLSCSMRGCLTEVYVKFNVRYENLLVCKGCLSEAIKSIDKHLIDHMKESKGTSALEDDEKRQDNFVDRMNGKPIEVNGDGGYCD